MTHPVSFDWMLLHVPEAELRRSYGRHVPVICRIAHGDDLALPVIAALYVPRPGWRALRRFASFALSAYADTDAAFDAGNVSALVWFAALTSAGWTPEALDELSDAELRALTRALP